MNLPRINGVNLPVFTLSALLVVAIIWWLRPMPETLPEPGPEWIWLEQALLRPVAEERLTPADLQQYGGSLWLQARPGELRLLYRAEFEREAASWRLQAGVPAAAEELQQVREELGLENGERQLQVEQVARFTEHRLDNLLLTRTPALTDEAWLADAGEPRLRLEMPEGQAWVYPPRGLSAHVEEGQVRLIQQVPASAMRGRQ
jgi:hypothetical protein